MKLSAEEKLMYSVMKALYESGIPIDFKGSMVLKACLLEMGYTEEIRHTVDIDANWYSDEPPTKEQMTDSLNNAIKRAGINLEARIYRMYGERRSAGFELIEPSSQAAIFSMDIDVNRPVQDTKIYQIEDLRFRGILPYGMIADKVSVVSTDKVFRRIKDFVDLYYISQVFELDYEKLLKALTESKRQLGDFNAFINGKSELLHAYEKFRFAGDVEKPAFDMAYSKVNGFLNNIIRIRRITKYEEIMRRIEQMLAGACDAEDGELADAVEELTAYYESDDWKADFEADEAGLLPKDLPRGVLSEDGVYNLLENVSDFNELYGIINT